MTDKIIYKETKDERKLDRFFMKNDLEYSDEHPVETDRVKCWEALADEVLAGGAALALRQNEYIIDGIAVDEKYRKCHIGKELLELALCEAQKRGGERVFLVARAPEFFRRMGFYEVQNEKAPNFFECLGCPQNNVTCFPKIMRLDLEKTNEK